MSKLMEGWLAERHDNAVQSRDIGSFPRSGVYIPGVGIVALNDSYSSERWDYGQHCGVRRLRFRKRLDGDDQCFRTGGNFNGCVSGFRCLTIMGVISSTGRNMPRMA